MNMDRPVIRPVPLTELSLSKKLKFGIQCLMRDLHDKHGGGAGEQVALDPDEPLTVAIAQVCKAWGFTDPTKFALKFNDPQGKYVTEEMRNNLVGKVVHLVFSPDRVVTDIEERLNNQGSIEQGLKDLVEKSYDPVVVDAFIARTQSQGGLAILLRLITSDALVQKEKALSNAFRALADVVINCTVPCWDLIEPAIYAKIVTYVNNTIKPVTERHALQNAYTFLEHAISQGPAFTSVEETLCFTTIIVNLNHPEPGVHLAAVTLLNTLLDVAEGETKAKYDRILNQGDYRELIVGITNGRKPKTQHPGEKLINQIRHQLYKLQCHRLSSIDARRNTPVDPNDPNSMSQILEIVTSAMGSDSSTNHQGSLRREKPDKSRDYKKLGFQNIINPIEDFLLPPGVLALECMHYLVKEQPQMYHEIILESLSSMKGTADECPFAKSSIELSSILCEELHIGEYSRRKLEKTAYWPFIFQHAHPFEELFCVCVQLVTKTWREMRATAEDFDKVFKVVRQQIGVSLKEIPADSVDANDFRKIVNSYTYERIMKLNETERKKDKYDYLQTKPMMQLRAYLEPSMRELIKQNRLNFLMKGTRFLKHSTKVTAMTIMKAKDNKHWFCRLAPNCKTFYYGDCDEKSSPLLEELKEKINTVDIVALRIGKDCPHAKEIKKQNLPLAFSIVTETEPLKTLDFIAPDDKTFNLWTDGINALIGKPMNSVDANQDLGILVDMEVKIRTLDIELIPSIPQDPPPIPPPPADFDFSAFTA